MPDKTTIPPAVNPESSATDAQKCRPLRCRHWRRWSLLVLLAAITATAPTGWLPRLANALLREYLRVRDLSAIQVRVERLTPWNLRAALRIGTNEPVSRIDRLDVRYSPGGLWHARIEHMAIDGGLLQFRAGTHGAALCGLPPDWSMRLRPGASPVDDEETVPQLWQAGEGAAGQHHPAIAAAGSQRPAGMLTLRFDS